MYEISLRIHEENELYNSFDESCRTLSGDVSDYLTKQYGRKEIGDEILLRIKCDRPIDAVKRYASRSCISQARKG